MDTTIAAIIGWPGQARPWQAMSVGIQAAFVLLFTKAVAAFVCAAALVSEVPDPPADAILDQLLENEILTDDQIAKALVAKQLEDESREGVEEEPAAEEPAA